MNYFSILLSAISWITANKSSIATIISSIEAVIPNAPGDQKSLQLRNAIALAMNLGPEVQTVWTALAPMINFIVSEVKAAPAPAALPAAA